MDLFEVKGGIVSPSIHALMISPFKEIWERDKSAKKSQAIPELTYIELSCSMKKSNLFSGYAEEIRPKKVAKQVFGREDWTPDSLVQEAIEQYRKLDLEASPSLAICISALGAVHKMKEFLDSYDPTERTPKGAMVIKPAEVSKTIKELPDMINSTMALRSKVEQELITEQKTKGQRQVGYYEDPRG